MTNAAYAFLTSYTINMKIYIRTNKSYLVQSIAWLQTPPTPSDFIKTTMSLSSYFKNDVYVTYKF